MEAHMATADVTASEEFVPLLSRIHLATGLDFFNGGEASFSFPDGTSISLRGLQQLNSRVELEEGAVRTITFDAAFSGLQAAELQDEDGDGELFTEDMDVEEPPTEEPPNGEPPPLREVPRKAVTLTLNALHVYRAGEDGTDGNAEWYLQTRVLGPTGADPRDVFIFSHGAVNDGRTFPFSPTSAEGIFGDNTFFHIVGPESSLRIRAGGWENDLGPRDRFDADVLGGLLGGAGPSDDLLPQTDHFLTPSDLAPGQRSFSTPPASGGGFSYELRWSMEVTEFTVFI